MMTRTLRLLALAGTCLTAPAALADDFDIEPVSSSNTSADAQKSSLKLNEITVGFGAVTGATALSGRYDGLDKSGGFTVGGFRMIYRNTDDPDDPRYAVFEGDDIDLTRQRLAPAGSLSLRTGVQGLWDTSLSYEGTPYAQSNSFRTLLNSSGNLQNGLTAQSINATATTGAATVNKYLATTSTGTQRDDFKAKASFSGLENWVLTSKVEHDHLSGSKINSMLFLGSANYASFAEPIDYDTDKITLTGAYTTKRFQAQLSYVFSNFANNQHEYDAQSPFVGAGRAGYSASQYSLAPDNMEHQLQASMGLNLTQATHLAMNARYGLQLQDSSYAARYYETPNAAAPGVSGRSYDGTIQNIYANTVLTSRPAKDWSLKASYSFDDRDNMSSVYKMRSYRGDSGTGTWNGSSTYQSNAPYSFLFQKAGLESSYTVIKGTKITVDYLLDDRQRTYSVTNHNQENTVGGQIRTSLTPELSNSLSYHRGIRSATAYNGNSGWYAMSRAVTGESRLAQYNYAGRVRDEVKDNLTWSHGGDWSLGSMLRYVMDDYPSTYFGVTSNRAISAGPDLSATLAPGLTGHLFYNYELNSIGSMTWTGSSTSSVIWHLQNRDVVHTTGASLEWKPSEHVTLSAEDTISLGNTAFEEASWLFGTASATTSTAISLPTYRSTTNILKLSGEYEVGDGLSLGLTGLWQRYLNQDYLLAQATSSSANQSATSVVASDGNGSYMVLGAIATVKMRW